MIHREEALEYHSRGRKGKIEVVPTKPMQTQRDLGFAYTPGVAEPCREIEKNPEDAYLYTAKGNLVAVVSNGTAVLGLGDIGALAGKPVMEGKGVLFKRFADIDVFDIELDTKDPEEIIRIVKALEPTFGGINLEDIKAPECFYIEESLKKIMNIPVFHDDQHGTAIISGAGLLNAVELVGKRMDEVRVVVSGAGAAGIACAKFYEVLGVRHENIFLTDTGGVIYKGRPQKMNPYKEYFAQETEFRTLADAMNGADVFLGVSVKGIVTKEMVRSMADKPIVFAMANPDPEISYEDATAARDDLIMATGRSDYPNQVNNVLGFPFIFRGALDVRARAINDEMKLAAARALADLAKEDVPDSVIEAYGGKRIEFGRECIVPKPLDPRVLLWEAPAVAKAAMDSGAARRPLPDLGAYRDGLEARFGRSREVVRIMINKAKRNPRRIVFPEGEEEKILRASQIIIDEKMAEPLLLGDPSRIRRKIEELRLTLGNIEIINPEASPKYHGYVSRFYEMRMRKGVTLHDAEKLVRTANVFGMMMVNEGDADGLISGLTQHYPETIRPALQIIKLAEGLSTIAGVYMMVMKQDVMFFADTTVNIDPTAEQLAEIAVMVAKVARSFDIEPRIAMLSFSNFGSVNHPLAKKMQRATELVRVMDPSLVVDGEMQAETAVDPELLQRLYSFSVLKERANVLIFPELQSANIAYKLLCKLGGAEAIGPILLGMRKPVHVLQVGAGVDDIVNMTAIAVVDAQAAGKGHQ
ncbi:MAG: NADP-dependent malic enzyme [Ignavibacteriales bacterium CG07_land_8_20_14_0_80_59_12]|nr:MAG: NADP-dependent malic enzyme [Ignavibacteriales bacterium CG07_land_8_20_14_0_80_59_12]